jgi:chromosome segregation protein
MYLKRIEIQGFKSFADPITIEFKEGLTCIVGPNGSGKSNISDAMRWVLGEQSARVLRGGKMEEIIFAGTESRRPKGMAEVSLIFDNSTGILPIDFGEVAIKRRLFRSGESEYFINGSQCRLRDIRELIMDTGIGVDFYSFVRQDQVGRIAEAKPQELREIFEEAAGVIKYKTQKQEAQRRLDSAQGNLDRMNDIILDIESRIDGLREESEKAKAHAELSERHKDLEINITLKNIENVQERNAALKVEVSEAEKEIARLKEQKTALEASLEKLRSDDSAKEISALAIREKLNDAENRMITLQGSAAVREEQERNILKEKERLTQEIALLAEKLETAKQQQESALSEERKSEQALLAIQAELAEAANLTSEKTSALQALFAGIDEQKNNLFEFTKECSLKEQELYANNELMSNFDVSKSRIEEELVNAETEKASLEADRREANQSYEALRSEIDSLTAEEDVSRKKLAEQKTQAAALRRETDKLLTLTAELSARKNTIEEMESNYEGYSSGVKSLMKQNLSGIEGVVAECIKVPKGLETAAETALGAALQNIITSDQKSAEDAISYLKENKAGRLTFLPVDKISPEKTRRIDGLDREDGFVGYLTDLIAYDDRYAAIFDHLIGKVIVAETLKDAIRISDKDVKKYKIVTKDGEIIFPTGAITGGAYKNKSANLLARRGEIDSLTAKLSELAEDTAGKETEIKSTEEALRSIERAIEELAATQREKAFAFQTLAARLDAFEYKLTEIASRVERRNKELSSIASDKDAGLGMNRALEDEIESLKSRIEILRTEAEKNEATTQEKQKESDAAAEAVTEIRLRAAGLTAERERRASERGNVEALIAEMEGDVRSKKNALEDISAAHLAVPNGEELASLLEKIESEKKTFETELESLVSDREENKAKIEDAQERTTTLYRTLESRIESKTSTDIELGRQDIRLTNWKEKLFEEFDLSYVHALDFKKADFVLSAAVKENREIKNNLAMIGEVNPGSIKEYEEVSGRYEFLVEQREDILKSMSDYQKIVEDMDKVSRTRFKECFDGVDSNFDGIFKKLFGGGKGTISLEEDKDPLESGIIINVQPPGKLSLASMESYSGGERTMIGIALMLSILETKPAPFCILDEVDAALDETNIHRFADYLRKFADVQFTLVTHQRSTMEYADTLFGVTMQEQGITSILSLMLGDETTEAFSKTLTEETLN